MRQDLTDKISEMPENNENIDMLLACDEDLILSQGMQEKLLQQEDPSPKYQHAQNPSQDTATFGEHAQYFSPQKLGSAMESPQAREITAPATHQFTLEPKANQASNPFGLSHEPESLATENMNNVSINLKNIKNLLLMQHFLIMENLRSMQEQINKIEHTLDSLKQPIQLIDSQVTRTEAKTDVTGAQVALIYSQLGKIKDKLDNYINSSAQISDPVPSFIPPQQLARHHAMSNGATSMVEYLRIMDISQATVSEQQRRS